ncbi:MAG: AMP-binding protein [Bacteroidota bacterium]
MSNNTDSGLAVRDLIWGSFKNYPDQPAIGYVDGEMLTYAEVKKQSEQLGFYLKQLGITGGDKLAILGPNSPNWVVCYLTALSLGIVAVPILPDFHASEIAHILKHAGVKSFILSRKQLSRMEPELIRSIPLIMLLEDFSLLTDRDNPENDSSWAPYEPGGSLDPFTVDIDPEELASLIYTSGTTGFSKGVMLSNRNLVVNIRQCYAIENLQFGDSMISILPLSHTYENTVGLLLPMSYGATINYLDKPPVASILIPAMKKVQPTHMLTVPLVIEKIFKSQIKGKVDKSAFLKFMYGWPPFRKFFHRLAGKKLYKTFGGRLRFFGIGGSKLDESTDRFLKEAGFPYAIGYGLTETAPLISGANAKQVRIQSAGKPVINAELVIHEPDPETGIGEIWARGENVMKGYYNEPTITSQVLLPGGWFRTGDLGVFDKDGYLYIKGRLKNVIIGASGENIYPEEIESVINRFQYVLESVVVEQKGRLVALVHFNYEELEKQFTQMAGEARIQVEKKIEEMKLELQQFVNSKVNRYSRLQSVLIQDTPFEKTATQKIKRYLYQK